MNRKPFLKYSTMPRLFPVLLLVFFTLLASCEQPAGSVSEGGSGDAELKSLNVDKGVLYPAFSKSCFEYSVTVRNAAGDITVTAATNSGKAYVTGAGTKTLDVGGNPFTVEVTAENGNNKIYTITVTRLKTGVIPVNDADDMAKIGIEEGWDLAGEYLLKNDITINNWTGIAAAGEAFSGVFDGNNKTITLNGLDLSDNVIPLLGNNNLAGVFSRVEGASGLRAIVKNLAVNVVSADIVDALSIHMSVGAVAGYAKYADFENITVQGQISAKNAGTGRRLYLGGVAGIAESSIIKACKNEAEIYGYGKAASGVYNHVGGIAGMFHGGTVFEDCHNTGDITGETSGGQTNVFAGGIAGGSRFSFGSSEPYYGRIENCSSTGNIHAEGGHYWSRAGGIAGVIAGRDSAGVTQIFRCNASGKISVKGPAGSWPYIGGIVASNTGGGLIEQCYFDGEVEVESEDVNDYTGGIAGYNNNLDSTIQDCWSSGTVKGFLNAGGIVGQNQAKAALRRCFSTAAIIVNAGSDTEADSANQGAGGIAGFSVSRETDGLALCVALNASVTAPYGFPAISRVAGIINPVYTAEDSSSSAGILKNNHARSDMPVTVQGTTKTITSNNDGIDGADCDANPSETFYTDLGWDFTNVWIMDSGYPKLKWQN